MHHAQVLNENVTDGTFDCQSLGCEPSLNRKAKNASNPSNMTFRNEVLNYLIVAYHNKVAQFVEANSVSNT